MKKTIGDSFKKIWSKKRKNEATDYFNSFYDADKEFGIDGITMDSVEAIMFDFQIVYLVDFARDKVCDIYVSRELNELCVGIDMKHINSSFSNRINAMAEVVEPEDKANFLRGMSHAGIKAAMEKSKDNTVFVNFRMTTIRGVIYYQNKIIKKTDDIYIVATTKRNNELETIRREEETANLVSVLAEEFATVITADLNTNTSRVIKIDPLYYDVISELPTDINGNITYASGIKSAAEKMIVPEELERFIKDFNVNNILNKTRNGESIIFNYTSRYNGNDKHIRAKIVPFEKCNGEKVIIGISNIDIEIEARESRAKLKETEAIAHIYEICRNLVEDFEYVCYIDYKSLTVSRFHASEEFDKLISRIPGDLPTSKRLDVFFRNIFLEEDINKMLKVIADWQAEPIATRPPKKVIDMRVKYEGKNIFYRMRIAMDKNNPKAYVLGIYNYDKTKREKIQKQEIYDILDAIATDYLMITYVNFDTGQVNPYRIDKGKLFATHVSSNDLSNYERTIEKFAEGMIHPEDRNFYLKHMCEAAIRRALENHDYYSVAFRMMENGESTWFENRVYRSKKGSDFSVVIGLCNIQSAIENEIKKREDYRLREIIDVINGLSDDVACVLLVDADTGYDKSYRLNTEYEKYIPGWKDETIYRDRMEMIAKSFVAEEFRADFLYDTRLSVVTENLQKNDVYFVNTRYRLEGKLQRWQVKFAKSNRDDSNKIVVGFRNVENEIKTRERQIAIISELAGDFDCINYVVVNENADKDVIAEYRVSPIFARIIPEWQKVKNFNRKMQLLSENVVKEYGREVFEAQSRRDVVLHHLEKEQAYYVNFTAIIEGEEVYFQMKYTADRDETGKIIGLVVGIHSVDDEIRREMNTRNEIAQNLKTIAEQKGILEEQQMLLEEAIKAKSRFLFNMSHDIRTPMNAIIGFNELAQKHVDDPEAIRGYLEKINLSSKHLLNLINDVLDMSKIEAGKIQSNIVPYSIKNGADSLYNICKGSAESKNIDFTVDYSGVCGQMVLADELHVNQVLMNVISNAIKYTLDGGKVSLTVIEEKSNKEGFTHCKYVIKDTGIGMQPEFLEHIFDSFSRERTTTISGIQGTGLGMSIVKRLVEHLEGSINIESQVDVGTIVTIEFDFNVCNSEGQPVSNENLNEISLEGKKILVVEDNELNREIMNEILIEQGIQVDMVVNGRKAVEKVAEMGVAYYDLILMDVLMPVMNGYDATMAIRNMPGSDRLPIVAMTANAFEEDKQDAFRAGMTAHLAKPINYHEMFNLIKKLIFEK